MIAGFAALAAGLLVARLVAPFYGLGPFLSLTLGGASLVALAVGCAAGARWQGTSRTLPVAMMASGLWLLAVLGGHSFLIERLGPLSRWDVALFAGLSLGPLMLPLGILMPAGIRMASGGGDDAAHVAGQVFSAFALGAAAAVALVPFVLLPALGLALTTALVGGLLIAGGVAALPRRGPLAGAVLLPLVGFAMWNSSRPAATTAGVVEQVFTGFQTTSVVDHDGARYLLQDGSIHAVIEPETMRGLRRSDAALHVARLLRPERGVALILGLRGGSLAKDLAGAGWKVKAVDADSVTIRIAAAHFGLRDYDAEVSRAELRSHLRASTARYDLIVLDAFADNFIEPELVTREWFALAAERLAEGGVLAVAMESMGWDDVLVRAVAATARTAFATVVALPTSEPPSALGSVVLLAANRPLEIPEGALPEPFDRLLDPVEHWSTVQMVHAWTNRFEPDPKGAVVLTDDRNPAELWGDRVNHAARQELHRFFAAAAR